MTRGARLLALGTDAPLTELTPESALELARALSPEGDLPRLRALHSQSGVSRRGSVLLDGAGCQELFSRHQGRGPSTAARLKLFPEAAHALAARASRRALAAAELDPDSITHLITVSCTGARSPGLDHDLILSLGLSPQVSRTNIGFMGCHGALNGMAVARASVIADPEATAMVVCAEVCSLHYHVEATWDQQVANAIFADGAACAIVGTATHGPVVRSFGSQVFPGSRDFMSWDIGDNGFEMRLSPRVPIALRRQVGPWMERWLQAHGLSITDIAGWAVHPGGRDILEAVRLGLNLAPKSLDASRSVLDAHGNMSSGTVLWVLDSLLRRGVVGPVVALAFGPGLTGEAMLLEIEAS